MKLIVLKYGESVFGEDYLFAGGRPDVLLPISFVIYLIRTGGKNILVDAGCDDGAGFDMSVFRKPVEVLRDAGLQPEEITDVVITHAHHDHVEAIRYYSGARIHIQRLEYRDAKRYIPDGFCVRPFAERRTLAPGVFARRIGGHTPGSSIVRAGPFVLCGDECYTRRNLTERIPTGSSCDPEKSRRFVERYSAPAYRPLLFHDARILPGRTGWAELPIP